MLGIDFIKKVEGAVEEQSLSDFIDVDDVIFVESSKFYKDVVDLGGDSDYWNELEKIAQEVNHKRKYWTLRDMSDLHNYFSRFGSAKGVVDFVNKYVWSTYEEVDWDSIAKFSKLINSEEDFKVVCSEMDIFGSDIRSKILRKVIGGIVRDETGKVYGSNLDIDIDYDDIRMSNFDDILVETLKDKETVREEVKSGLKSASRHQSDKVYNSILKYAEDFRGDRINSDELIEAVKNNVGMKAAKKIKDIVDNEKVVHTVIAKESTEYVKVLRDVKYGEDVIVPKGTVGTITTKEGKDWTVTFESSGIVVTSGADDFEVVSEVDDPKEKYLVEGSLLDTHCQEKISKKICPVCSGDLYKSGRKQVTCSDCGVDIVNLSRNTMRQGYRKAAELDKNTITTGKAVRVEGDPASPFYGKTGLVERVTKDGWVGVNMRDGNYIERFPEDLAPVQKTDYTK